MEISIELTSELLLAVIGGLMGVFSAAAALRSAGAAESANKHLREQQLLSARTAVAQLVATAGYEFERNSALAERMRQAIKQEAIFVGGMGGSVHRKLEKNVNDQMEKSLCAFKEAERFIGVDSSLLSKLALADVENAHFVLPSVISRLRTIGDELQRDSDSSAARLLQHHERAINAAVGPGS